MEAELATKRTGAEEVVWNLADLYAGPADPKVEQDMKRADERAEKLSANYRGKLAALDDESLYEAVAEYEGIVEIATKLGSYAHLLWSTDTGNAQYGALLQRATEWTSRLEQQMVFFDLEWINAPGRLRPEDDQQPDAAPLPALAGSHPPLPAAPPERAGGENPLRKVGHGP